MKLGRKFERGRRRLEDRPAAGLDEAPREMKLTDIDRFGDEGVTLMQGRGNECEPFGRGPTKRRR